MAPTLGRFAIMAAPVRWVRAGIAGADMLEFKLTRHHAGLVLWGYYAALERAHGLVHRVVEESPVIDDKEGFVLGLAYDLRKAFEGQRSKAFRSDPDGSRCRIYGVEILWPVILVQVGLLRQAMGFIVTNRLDQSIMFELEHVVETAVRAAEPGRADEILEWMGRVGSAPYSHLAAVLDSRCRYFIECPPAKRLSTLPRLMETFDPMYEFLAEHRLALRPGIISPEAFAGGDREWPDFKW